MSLDNPNCIKIEVLDLETEIKTEYNSLRAAAKALLCPRASIMKNIKSKKQKPYRGRYILKLL
jgi:hypothetical protein